MNLKTAAIIASFGAAAYIAPAPEARAVDPGFYIGGYYGWLQRDANKSDEIATFASDAALIYESFEYQPLSINPRRSFKNRSFGIIGGYRWTPNFAVEAAWLDLSKLKFRSEDEVIDLVADPPQQGLAEVRYSFEMSAFAFSALGVLPLTYEWELFGRAGFTITNTRWRARLLTFNSGVATGDDKDDIDFIAGAGMSYTFLDVYTLRAEYSRIFNAGHKDLLQNDVDLILLGILVSF
jgi:OOP family OmpA-OmpF porin